MANLTNEDKNILQQLNIDVINTIKKRRDWLDSKMQEYAEMQIGDNIYNLETGLPIGVVSKVYRLWRDTDEGFRDKVLDINYEYKTKQEENPVFFIFHPKVPLLIRLKKYLLL